MVLFVVFDVSFYSELIVEFDRAMNLKCRMCLHLCTCLCLLAVPTITVWTSSVFVRSIRRGHWFSFDTVARGGLIRWPRYKNIELHSRALTAREFPC